MDLVEDELSEKALDRMREKLERLPLSYRNGEDFNAFAHVVELLRSDNVAKSHSDLERYCRSMDAVRKDLVDVYFQQFNKAIRNYTSILAAVNEAKNVEGRLHEATSGTAQLLRSKSAEVSGLHAKTLNHEYMVKLLDQIEEIKQFPAKYGSYIEEGDYLRAAQTLVAVHKQLSKESMRGIGALSAISKKINEERDNLHKTLIEVLHNIIYLKTENESRVIVALEDDGKPGFTRTVVGAKQDGDEVQVMTSIFDQQDQAEVMHSLVAAIWTLDRTRLSINTILGRIRTELRQVIQSLLKRKGDDSTPKPFRKNLGESISRLADSRSSYGNPDFVSLLKIIFKRCKHMLSNHNFVVEKFKQHFNRPAEAESSDTSFLPSLAQTDRQTRLSSYNFEHVWVEFQKELQLLIGLYIAAPKDQHTAQSLSENSSGSRLFSFSGSSAFTQYEDETAGNVTYADFDLGQPPSPYNLTPIYPLILNFNDSVIRVSSSRDPSALMGLRNWVDDFVTNSFMKHIKNDYKKRMEVAMEAADAFRPREKLKAGSSGHIRPLLGSTVEVHAIFDELKQDILSMSEPHYVSEFQKIMVEILAKYHHSCQNKYFSLFKGDKEALKLIMSEKYRLMMMTDPQYRRFVYEKTGPSENDSLFRPTGYGSARNSSPDVAGRPQSRTRVTGMTKDEKEEQALFEEHERQVEEAAYLGFRLSVPEERIKLENLTLENSSLLLLANMHDSLLWLLSRVENFAKSENSQSGSIKHSIFITKRIGSAGQKKGGTSTQTVNVEIKRIVKEFRRLSEECLLSLRVEFRLWSFAFLDQIRRTSFVYDMDYDREPNNFVAELGHHYMRAYEIVNRFLPRQKIIYLFGPLPSLVARQMMRALPKISAINQHGISKIKRDTFFLAQTFQNILDMPEMIDADFNRVRKYYELLAMSPDELLNSLASHIAERSNIFTLEEVTTVLAFLSPQKTISADTLNYLKNLFADTYVVNKRSSRDDAEKKDL